MKPTINTVNPKAGTLKPMINAVRNNFKKVSSKLIAFVLIPGTILANMSFVQDGDSLGKGINNEAATATTVNKTDTCCVAEKGKVVELNRREVKLVLPSDAMMRRADSEVISNLLSSIKEQNHYITALFSNIADVEISRNFQSDVYGKISFPAGSSLNSADDVMNASFIADHVGISRPAAASIESADENINSLFIAETEGVKLPMQSMATVADQEMNSNFDADTNFRISLPSAEGIAKADNEISKNVLAENAKYIAKATKKGHK